MNITVLYVGSSLLAPLKNAEREINRVHKLDLRVAAYNFGSPLSDREWAALNRILRKRISSSSFTSWMARTRRALIGALEDRTTMR